MRFEGVRNEDSKSGLSFVSPCRPRLSICGHNFTRLRFDSTQYSCELNIVDSVNNNLMKITL